MTPTIRKEQAPAMLQRAEFHERFMQPYQDPAFGAEHDALKRIELIAWQANEDGKKSPVTRKAGPGYADPDDDLSIDWLEAKSRIDAAQAAWGYRKRARASSLSMVRPSTTALASTRCQSRGD